MSNDYARLGDLPLEAVGEDELTDREFTEAARDSIRRDLTDDGITEHWQTAIHDQLVRDHRSVELQFPADTRVVFAQQEKAPSIWDRIEAWIDRWTLRLIAATSVAVFSYVGLAYFNVIPVVQP